MDSSAGEHRGGWTGFVVPGFVALLLGFQFFLGFRGFDHPDGGLLGLLEAPGALLGWGGVVILAVLLGWLIAGLVGRDLFGLQGASGLGVRLVGCVALGLAFAGVFGLLGGQAAGGEVGAGIGGLLGDSLGAVAGILLLLLMAIPALVLSISPFFTTGPRAGPPGAAVSMDALSELEPKPGLYEGTTTHQPKPLYPERRFDEDGNEVPMSFDGRDVGPVRYADEERDPDTLPQQRKPDPVPVPDAESLPEGVRFADDVPDDALEGTGRPDPVEAGDGRIPLPDGVRYVDDETPAATDGTDEAPPEADEEEDEDADEEERVEAEPAAPAPRPPAVPNVTPAPHAASPPPTVRGADALGQLQDEDEGARYRAKLEGSGIFDEPAAPSPPAAPEEPPKPKATRKKPAAKTKKKPAARKKAGTKTKKKAPAKKKPAASKAKAAAPPKKKPAAKKKAPAGRKAPAAKAKRSATSRGAAPDPEPPEEPPVVTPPRRKGAGATGPEDEVYRKAVEVAMERSAASSVLLSRRLGIGYAQARALIELLVKDRILGEMTPSGSRPLLITEEEWEERTG